MNWSRPSLGVDIAPLYCLVKQRAERDRLKPWGDLAEVARMEARAIIKNASIAQIKRFAAAENEWLRHRDSRLTRVAPKFENAIRSKNWYSSHRTVNNLNTGYDPDEGWVYVFGSRSRPGEVKIGCTKNSLRRRLLMFRRTHDAAAYSLTARWVRWPARLENMLHKQYAACRIAKHAWGKSTEWFRVDGLQVEFFLNRLLTRESEYWTDSYEACLHPEASGC